MVVTQVEWKQEPSIIWLATVIFLMEAKAGEMGVVYEINILNISIYCK